MSDLVNTINQQESSEPVFKLSLLEKIAPQTIVMYRREGSSQLARVTGLPQAKDGVNWYPVEYIDSQTSTPGFVSADEIVNDVMRTWDMVKYDGAVVEVRALLHEACRMEKVWDGWGSSIIGFFDNYPDFFRCVSALEKTRKAKSIYVVLNPVSEDLLGRANNRLVAGKEGNGSSDTNIIRRRWMLTDFDPIRPAGISSTDEELDAAIARRNLVVESLQKKGWPLPGVSAISGNGAHADYYINLPNNEASKELLSDVLKSLQLQYGDKTDKDKLDAMLEPGQIGIQVDETTFNASRVCKLYGSFARKGDDIPKRPHRLSFIDDVQTDKLAVSVSLLEAEAQIYRDYKRIIEEEQRAKLAEKRNQSNGDKPDIIGEFNRRVSISDILEENGYTIPRKNRGSRPGQPDSLGVIIDRDANKSYHHSDNDKLKNGHRRSPFDVLYELECGKDMKAALKAAAEQVGIEWTDAKVNKKDTNRTQKQNAKRVADELAEQNQGDHDINPIQMNSPGENHTTGEILPEVAAEPIGYEQVIDAIQAIAQNADLKPEDRRKQIVGLADAIGAVAKAEQIEVAAAIAGANAGFSQTKADQFVRGCASDVKKKKKAEIAKRKASRDEDDSDEMGRYTVRNGCIGSLIERDDEDGNPLPPRFEALCNFNARIGANVYRDDGLRKRLSLALDGELYDYTTLPRVEIASEDYDRMRWVVEKWGGRPSIEPGEGKRDQLRHAIQWLSEQDGIVDEYVYAHTGWRVIDDKRVFLHAGGAIGMDGVSVDLSDRLRFYEFPTDNAIDPATAMIESIKLMDVAVPTVSYPLWAIAYAAPLSEIIKPAHVNWVEGSSGNLKTSFCSVLMNHFGKEFGNNCTPADWSGTGNSLEGLSFWAKDVMFLIDDFKPGSDKKEADKMREAASKIISSVGNRSGRSRLNSDSTLQQTYYPRGLVVSTAEKGTMGYSTNARMLTIPVEELGPKGIDKDKLAVAQKQRHVYGYAMRGFIEYIADRWEEMEKLLPNRLIDLRNEFSAPGHLRLPDAAAVLFVGFQVAMEYAVHIGAIEQAEMDKHCQMCKQVLMTIASEQAQRVKSEDPALQYIQTVITMIGSQKAFVVGKADCGNMGAGDMIGWHDTETVYLTSYAYNLVCQYVNREGSKFPSDEKTLRLELIRQGYVEKVTKGRTNLQINSPITGTNERVIAISLEKFNRVASEMGINPLDLYSPNTTDDESDDDYDKPATKHAKPRVRLGHYSDPSFGKVNGSYIPPVVTPTGIGAPLDDAPDFMPPEPPAYVGSNGTEPEVVTWTL